MKFARLVAAGLSLCLMAASPVSVGVNGRAAPAAYLINDGDSFSAQSGSSQGFTILTYVVVQGISPALQTYSVGVPGLVSANIVTNFAANIGTIYTSAVARFGSSVPFVVHFMIGANDIRNSVAFATTYANWKSYVNLVHGLGANAKVVIATIPLQCDIQQSAPENSQLQTMNNSIYANWNVAQGSGGIGADGLDDWFANPTVGMNTYASSAFCGFPNIYTTDGQHGTNLTKSILGPVEAAAAQPLL